MHRPFSAQRAVPICCSSRCTKPKPPHRPVIISVARLTDLTTPNSENSLLKLATVVREDKFCTNIFVIEFFYLALFQGYLDFAASFLDFFAALRSLGVSVAFFLTS